MRPTTSNERARARAACAAFAALSALAAGCASSRGGPVNTYRGEEGVHQVAESRGSQGLARDLEMRIARSERVDDRLVVQFELHNKKQVDLPIEWTIDWYDENEMRIQWDRPWKPLVLPGRGYQDLQIIAPTPAARAWKLALRRPHPVR